MFKKKLFLAVLGSVILITQIFQVKAMEKHESAPIKPYMEIVKDEAIYKQWLLGETTQKLSVHRDVTKKIGTELHFLGYNVTFTCPTPQELIDGAMDLGEEGISYTNKYGLEFRTEIYNCFNFKISDVPDIKKLLKMEFAAGRIFYYYKFGHSEEFDPRDLRWIKLVSEIDNPYDDFQYDGRKFHNGVSNENAEITLYQRL